SCDGNLIVEDSIYDAFLAQLQKEGGYLAGAEEKQRLQTVMWDAEGHRTLETVARSAAAIAEKAGFRLPPGAKFIIVEEDRIGRQHPFSGEKLAPVLAIFRCHGFDMALDMMQRIFEVAGKGHSCGIYSFDEE